MRPPRLHRRSVLGRIVRIVWAAILVVVGVSALVVGGTWTLLRTRAGGEVARRLLLPRLNGAIAGHVGVGRLTFGGDRLALENVSLYDPEGRLVISIRHAEIAFAPLALLRRRLDASALEIRSPQVFLAAGPRGLNIARALAARSPSPPAPRRPPAPHEPAFVIELRGWTISNGTFDYRADGAGGPHLRVARIAASGALGLGQTFNLSTALDAPGLHLEGRGEIDVASGTGRSDLEARVRATVPGATIAAHGTAATDGLDLAAEVDARDLRALARALTPFVGGLPELSGRGHVEATVIGAPGALWLRAAVRLPSLGVGRTRVRDLRGSAVIPDLRAPDAFDLDLRAAEATVGGRRWEAPVVLAHTAGSAVRASVRIAGPSPFELSVGGRRERARPTRAFIIDTLDVSHPEASFTLAHPARLELGPDRVVLSGLSLTDGRQCLDLDLSHSARGDRARLAATAIDLGRLPRALVPSAARLGGRLDAVVQAERERAQPRLRVTATIAGGRMGRVRGIALRLDGEVARGRARGRLAAHGLGTGGEAHFDLPARWPPVDRTSGKRGRAPFEIDVRLSDTDLARVTEAARAFDLPLPALAGHLRLAARVDGSPAHPALAIDLHAAGLTVRGAALGDLTLAARGENDQPISARFEAASLAGAHGARGELTLRTPLSLRDILRAPGDRARLARAPIDLAGAIEALPLAALAPFAPRLPRLQGTASAKLALAGTVAEPTGTATIDVAGAASSRFPPTDARVELGIDHDAITARARVTRKEHALLAVEGRLGARWQSLRDPAALGGAPLSLRVVVGPLSIKRHGLPAGTPRAEAGSLRASVHADLTVDGTLRAPRAVLRAETRGLQVDARGVGNAQIEASYADQHAKVTAHLVSANGGQLQLTATATVDLGYPAVVRGLHLGRAPLEVRLDAQGLDLAGLSGVTPAVSRVGGLLTASLEGRGTVASPHLQGRLEWKDGALTVTGFGQYQDIHLAVHGDERKVVIDDLAAKSGTGHARITGEGTRDGEEFKVALQTDVASFPVYTDGQPLGLVSLDARLSGRLGRAGGEIDADVREAHAELTETDRRDPQSLDVPADVVLVQDGRPKGKKDAEKLRAHAALLPGSIATPAPPPAKAPAAPKLAISVHASNKLWIVGKDAKIELGLGPEFRIELGDDGVEMFGKIIVQRGRVDVLGRRFDIKADSTVEWSGAAETPELDIEAQYDNSNEGVSVVVTIKGAPGRMSIRVSSPNRPDLTESQLYTLLISGHIQGGPARSGTEGFSATAEAASLAGGLLATALQKTLARRLPLDVLTIDPGSGASLTGTQVEAGRYLTDRLYVGYVGRIGADPTRYQNRNAVHAEYRLGVRWVVEGEYGDVGTGSADVLWKKNY
jgi:translocation and assembly module TamB